ncbi:MAG: hypothetical protein AAB596_00430 [Patescibacteria group bacterium]
MLNQLVDATMGSLLNVWGGIINFIPALIGSLVILIVGLIIAAGLGSLVERIISMVKIDNLIRRSGLASYIERAGLQVNSGRFVGALVYWFFIIVIILAISDVLGLFGLSQFLREVVSYAPNVIIAALILLATIVVANFLRSLIRASVMSARLHASKFLGTLVWWLTIIFGFVAALMQLGIAPVLLNTIITGIVAMIALGGGIAIGLGGKDYAASLINRLREHTE